jgi:alkaline phosphatase D
MKYLSICIFALFTSCTATSQGFLVQFDEQKSIDSNSLERKCDMEDSGSCFLLGKSSYPDFGSVPILRGLAPSGKAILAALLPKDFSGSWLIFDRTENKLKKLPVIKSIAKDHSSYRIEHILITSLPEGKKLEVLLVDQMGLLIDHREIENFSSKIAPFRFALVSCSDDRYEEEQKILWEQLYQQKPNVIFAIGDNVYADWRAGKNLGKMVAPDVLWDRYAETRSTLSIFRKKELLPFFATWDDHDFGMNDGNFSYPHVEESRIIMEAFFPYLPDAKTILEGPGVAKATKIDNHLFILFDDRSFRSPNEMPAVCYRKKHDLCKKYENQTTNPESTHFGQVQEEWAMGLVKSHNGASWLISGDQWFGSYHPFESYEGNHPISFKRFLKKLENSVILAKKEKRQSYIIFASGDRHLNETMKLKPFLNYSTYEFTSSGIHASTFPDSWKDFPNSRKLQGASGEMNYSIFQLDWRNKGILEINHQAWGKNSKSLFQNSLQLKPVFKKISAKD